MPCISNSRAINSNNTVINKIIFTFCMKTYIFLYGLLCNQLGMINIYITYYYIENHGMVGRAPVTVIMVIMVISMGEKSVACDHTLCGHKSTLIKIYG